MTTKRILTLLATLVFASSLSFAQTPVTGAGSVIFGSATPTGVCSNSDWFVNTVSGSLYICSKGSWLSVGGSGSGAATDLSNLTSPTAINLTTLTFAGAAGLKASGTNQNITLTPSGAGSINLGAASVNWNIGSPGAAAYLYLGGSSGSSRAGFKFGGSGEKSEFFFSFFNNGNVTGSVSLFANTGNVQKLTMTGNVTLTMATGDAGAPLSLIICQDSVGSHTFTWPANFKGGMAVGSTLSTCSAQSFVSDGTSEYATTPGVTGM